MDSLNPIEKIITLFNTFGGSQYGGEPVSQMEHALQAAQLALDSHAKPSLIIASLLHDVGHLLHNLPDDAPENGIDDLHENLGHDFLSKHFISSVVQPAYLHVSAKRYLCATDSAYISLLSEPSLVSLELQGGTMNDQEVKTFEQNEWYLDAVALRKMDDQAKIPNAKTKSIEYYIPMMEGLVK